MRRASDRQAVVYAVGARPNFVKMAPVLAAMRRRAPWARHVLVHAGQHYDRELSTVFFEELDVPLPDYQLAVGSGSHGEQTARALERMERVLAEVEPTLIVVPGDVNTTLAAALAAVKLEIPIAHLESGLRSFDRTMPEEINRILVDQISDWCFIHSPGARDNLLREGVAEQRIFFAGNTMIDTLVKMRPRFERSRILRRLELPRGGYVLVTLHRPKLVDGPELTRVIERLERLSRSLPVVFPLHPRTRSRLGGLRPGAPGLHLIDPVGYVDFLALEASAAAVLTDSGGVQEETTFLRVPCFTLRENTERPVTIERGTNTLLGLDAAAIDELPGLLERSVLPLEPPEAWDGHAADRVADVLVDALAPVRLPLSARPDRRAASAVQG